MVIVPASIPTKEDRKNSSVTSMRIARTLLFVAASLVAVTDGVILTPELAMGACPPDGNGVYYNATYQCGYSLPIGDGFNRSRYSCNSVFGDDWFCSIYHPNGFSGMLNTLGFCCPKLDAYPASYTCEFYKDCNSCIEDDTDGHSILGKQFNCGWDGEYCMDLSVMPKGFNATGGNYTFRTKLAQCDDTNTDYYALYGKEYGTLFGLQGQCTGRCGTKGWADPKKGILECKGISAGVGGGTSGMTDAQVANYVSNLIPAGVFVGPSLNTPQPTVLDENTVGQIILDSLSRAPMNGQPNIMPAAMSMLGAASMQNGYGSLMMGIGGFPGGFGAGGPVYGSSASMGMPSSYGQMYQANFYGSSLPYMGRQYGYGYSGYGYGSYGFQSPVQSPVQSPMGPQQYANNGMTSLILQIQNAALNGITDPATGDIQSVSSGTCTRNNECSCDQGCKNLGNCCSDWYTTCPELL